ncbi:hypothetical protein ACKKBG_A22980 [Auxenochlorella protothecoides x Auxenochlorella symbiontica]|uniref:Bifunctional inhibitor/plant lipid transfer protein/seed storage helical domain-containing protein n=1 Tax=Auxenochlorella protothecoides TaxID=3075 RepID=A0A1D2AEH0_AUXPR
MIGTGRRSLLVLALLAIAAGASPETEPNPCIALGLGLLTACNSEARYLVQTFPFNAVDPITMEQLDTLIGNSPPGIPTDTCCNATITFLEPPTECNCDPGLLDLIPTAGVTLNGLAGMLEFVGASCGSEPVQCT